MAQLQKFSAIALNNQIRHIDREIKYPKNVDIDINKSEQNYVLSPDRNMTSYKYLKQRLSELHCSRRKDIKPLAGWVITAPKELASDDDIDRFFKGCYKFLINRYGEKNCVRCVVHKDESGRPHLHFAFIPVVKNENPMNDRIKKARELKEKNPELSYREMANILGCTKGAVHKWLHTELQADEKVSAHERLNRNDLIYFHRDLQKSLNEQGIKGKVLTGVTKAIGGGMTVAQLKAQRDFLIEHGTDCELIVQTVEKGIISIEQLKMQRDHIAEQGNENVVRTIDMAMNLLATVDIGARSRVDDYGVETIDFDM